MRLMQEMKRYAIDFHLKGCIVGQKCKINVSGSTKRFFFFNFFKAGWW